MSAENHVYDGLLCVWCLHAMQSSILQVRIDADGARHDLRRISEAREALGLGHISFSIDGQPWYSLRADTQVAGDAVCWMHMHVSLGHRSPTGYVR
jgi:hypothetical protein